MDFTEEIKLIKLDSETAHKNSNYWHNEVVRDHEYTESICIEHGNEWLRRAKLYDSAINALTKLQNS